MLFGIGYHLSFNNINHQIMNMLVGLCKPDPHGKVPFEPVRDKMLELYESSVDHPDFYHAFRVVLDAGGHDSPHMADLHEFTKVYVNPKLRKMRFEAYDVVADYPIEFPKLKNACLKWAWKQTPKRGWCELPPTIHHRVSERSALSMLTVMRDIESALCVFEGIKNKDIVSINSMMNAFNHCLRYDDALNLFYAAKRNGFEMDSQWN